MKRFMVLLIALLMVGTAQAQFLLDDDAYGNIVTTVFESYSLLFLLIIISLGFVFYFLFDGLGQKANIFPNDTTRRGFAAGLTFIATLTLTFFAYRQAGSIEAAITRFGGPFATIASFFIAGAIFIYIYKNVESIWPQGRWVAALLAMLAFLQVMSLVGGVPRQLRDGLAIVLILAFVGSIFAAFQGIQSWREDRATRRAGGNQPGAGNQNMNQNAPPAGPGGAPQGQVNVVGLPRDARNVQVRRVGP